MATMSAQDPVFDTFFIRACCTPVCGAAGWPSLCSPCWPVPARARDKLADYLAPAAARVSRKQAYIADTNLKICFPISTRRAVRPCC